MADREAVPTRSPSSDAARSPASKTGFERLLRIKGYDSERLVQDVVAGITVGVLLIPQSMSYSILAGLPPIYGMYACTVPLFVFAMVSSSTQLQIGTVATTSILLQSAVSGAKPASQEEYVLVAITVTFITGVVQVAMGLLRFGFLANLLSWPVMSGFTSASACIIGASQLKYIVGVFGGSGGFFPQLVAVARGLPHLNAPTLALSLLSIASLQLAKKSFRLPKWFPIQLALIVVTTAASFIFDLEALGIAIVGPVPAGFPAFSAPALDASSVIALLPSCVVIAIVSYVGSISLALVFGKQVKEAVNPNRELIALGLACCVGACFQGHVVTGSFSRTALNRDMGATSVVAGIVTAVLMLMSLLFLSPMFEFLPMSTLAVLIITSLQSLVKFEDVELFWKVNRHDFWQVAVTFAAVLVVGIDTGIMLAVSVSVALLLYRSFVPTVVVLSATPTSAGVDASVHRTVHPAAVDGFETVRLEGEMHFVNKQVVVDRLQQLLVKLMPVERGRHGAERPDSPPRHVRPRGVVLDGSCIPHIDVTACQALVETMDSFRDAGMVLLFSGFPVSSFSTLQRYVQDKASGRIVVNYATVDEALASVCASPLATAAAVHV